MMLTTHDKAAAFHISFSLAGIAKLKAKAKPKSREWNRLDAAEDTLNRLLDCYDLTQLHDSDMANATRIFEMMEAEVDRLYEIRIGEENHVAKDHLRLVHTVNGN